MNKTLRLLLLLASLAALGGCVAVPAHTYYEPAPVVYVPAPAYYGPVIRFGVYGGGGHRGHYHGGRRGHGHR